MKKTLVALAALAATGVFAQSTVSLTGNLGFGFQSQAVARAVNPNVAGLAMTDATVALTAVEDLGGGMRATANMTFDTSGAQFNVPGNFNRRNASVGLSGGFGSIVLANTRTSDLLTRAMVAPASLPDGPFDSTGILARAAMDGLMYTTPNFSGFTGSLSYVETGAPGAAIAGYANAPIPNAAGAFVPAQGDGTGMFTTTAVILGLNYANGPLAAGLAFKSSNYNSDYIAGAATVAAGNIARNTNTEGFVTYDFGMARVGLGFDTANSGVVAGGANDATAWAFGVAVPVGAATVGVNWAQRDTFNMYEAVVNYDLSRRTAVNFSFGRQSADALAGVSDGNQYRLRLLHSF